MVLTEKVFETVSVVEIDLRDLPETPVKEIGEPLLSHPTNEEAGPEGYVIQPWSLSSLEAGTGENPGCIG